jgi:ABC-type phosphate/phosphonate transport system substrate-binding protein
VPSFAHDANLRFPLEDPVWRDFFARHELEAVAYDDMTKLGEDLAATVAAVAYLPAGNYFYLRDDPSYLAVASALGAPDDAAELASVMIVPAASEVTEIGQLRGARLAYTHRFCTTSYFATALLLHQHGESIGDFFELVEGYAFEAQIEAVLDGTAEATMVQESVWRKRADAMDATRVLGRHGHLPGPLMLVGRPAEDDLAAELAELLVSHRPPLGPRTLFSGFAPYRRQAVAEFCEASAVALPAAGQV